MPIVVAVGHQTGDCHFRGSREFGGGADEFPFCLDLQSARPRHVLPVPGVEFVRDLPSAHAIGALLGGDPASPRGGFGGPSWGWD